MSGRNMVGLVESENMRVRVSESESENENERVLMDKNV